MQRNRIEVKVKDEDGKDVVYYATRPTPKQLSDAQMVAGKILKSGMKDRDVLMRHQLRDYLVSQGLWSEEQEKLVDKLNTELVEDLTKLKAGGIKLSEAKDLAIQIRAKRQLKLLVEMQKLNMDEFTLESIVENTRFDYLVSVCSKTEEGGNVYESIDDYRAKAELPYSVQLASSLSQLVHRLEPDWEEKLPENQFLKKHKFIGDDLRLVNKDGHYVTADGKRVDADFNYVDEEGNIVDEHKVKLDKDGLPLVESKPFLDDDGNPVE
jgi:hypothetical protein